MHIACSAVAHAHAEKTPVQLHQLQTASIAEKNCFDMTKLILQVMCVIVVQWSRSCLNVQKNRVRLPATLFSVSSYRFFFFLFGLFFNTIFPFGLFVFILTADPPGHALGSIYILSLSPEFYFGKGISNPLDLHTGQAYDQKKKHIKLSRHDPRLKQLDFFQC